MQKLGIIRNGRVYFYNHYGAPIPFVHALFPDRVPADRDITKMGRLIPEKLYLDGNIVAFTETVPFVLARKEG